MSSAGAAIIASRLSSGVSRGIRGRIVSPALRTPIQIIANCAMPESGTDQISHRPASPPEASPITSAEIITTFIMIGAAAATAKRPSAFRMPLSSAVSEMKRM